MPKENQSDGRAHDCDHEQIFCAHGHIHAHRKSRVIGVLMAMCTSKPIIGKRAPRTSVVSKSRKFIFLVKDLLAGWDHDGFFLIVTIGDKGFQLFREDVRCGFSPVFVIAHLEYHLK